MSPDVLLECPRTSFRDVLRVNATERAWIFPKQAPWGTFPPDAGLFKPEMPPFERTTSKREASHIVACMRGSDPKAWHWQIVT